MIHDGHLRAQVVNHSDHHTCTDCFVWGEASENELLLLEITL